MSLVVWSGLCGLAAAPVALHPILSLTALLCIAVGAGAAGAFNMWYERVPDRRMARTRHRPLAAGRMEPSGALGFSVVLGVGAVTVMGLALNGIAAALLALAILWYAVVYTMWLKPLTAQSIVYGGAAGALPPVIGWAAATGGVAPFPLLMAVIIFLWTPPHFWALALRWQNDYAAAGFPMLPALKGRHATRKAILAYALALSAASVAPLLWGMAGALYGVVAVAVDVWLVTQAVALYRHGGDGRAMRLFFVSILYLFALFAAFLLEAVGRGL